MQLINLVSEQQLQRMEVRQHSSCPELWELLEQVKDPEIPALSIWDMGILQDVQLDTDQVKVVITPTYSGCPAMDLIKEDIKKALLGQDYTHVNVITKLSPAWTTEWMSDDAKRRMRESGIASPTDIAGNASGCGICNVQDIDVLCPMCQSSNTRVVSEFGSTACKALMQCNDCGEPFDYFKQI